MFEGQRRYWDERYKRGGCSGSGSTGEIREWKWRILDNTLVSINHIIDYGCGDLSFWGFKGKGFDAIWHGRDCEDYTGIDVSPEIIERNRNIKPDWRFYTTEELDKAMPKSNVFCFDVLFHIIPESDFLRVIDSLCLLSTERIFIYTWNKSPFNFSYHFSRVLREMRPGLALDALKYIFSKDTDGVYQKFRPLREYYDRFEDHGFEHRNVYYRVGDIGAMYLFGKIDEG